MPCLVGPLQGKVHAGQKVGHESIALLQKSCRYSCPVQASEQALQACLPYPHLAEPRSSHMQVPPVEQVWACNALAQFLSWLFSDLSNSFWGRLKEYVPNDVLCHLLYALAGLAVYKNIWLISSNLFCISFHNCKVSANMGCQIDLIYDQKITCLNSQTSFPRVFISSRYIDYVNKVVCQCWTKSGGDVVTPTFNNY